MKKPLIAKILIGQSLEALEPGFFELSNSIVASSLKLSKIKLARILAAGYSFFPESNNYIFCILLEKAPGKSIKEILHGKFDTPNLFIKVLVDSAQYLTYFHVNYHREFRELYDDINSQVVQEEIEDREKFCIRRISTFLDDIGFSRMGVSYFNVNEAIRSIEGIFLISRNGSYGSPQDSHETRTRLEQYLVDTRDKFKEWISSCSLIDRVTTHGDMTIGNLCYNEDEEGYEVSLFDKFMIIDYSTIQRSYGAIGDPADDVGRFIGSVWKEVALCFAHSFGDKINMEAWYKILSHWQEIYLDTYIKEAYSLRAQEGLQLNIMANFKERVNFYKLCFFIPFFDKERIYLKAEDLLNARRLLLYFMLREYGLLN